MRKTPRVRASVMIATLVAVFGLTLGTQTSFGHGDDHPTLPDGPGRDLMIRVCSQCHAPELAANQELDKAGWKDLVDQMASNGATATDAEFDQIVSYLSTAFPAPK